MQVRQALAGSTGRTVEQQPPPLSNPAGQQVRVLGPGLLYLSHRAQAPPRAAPAVEMPPGRTVSLPS